MSTSYIPDETIAVCTFQISPNPQPLIASRNKITVFNKEKPLLTTEDRNLSVQFTCKSPVNIAASLLAFGAGLVAFALLASNPIGWLAIGFLVVGAIYAVKAVTHTCTAPLKAGSWFVHNDNITFDGYSPITEKSILLCNSGGIVKPFFSLAIAKNIASYTMITNGSETLMNATVSFAMGMTWTGFASLLSTKMFMGLAITWTGQTIEREIIRSNNDYENNDVYQNMNEYDGNYWGEEIDDPSDFNGLESFYEVAKNKKEFSQNKAFIQDFERLKSLNRQTLRKNDFAKTVFKNIRNEKYGKEVTKAMKLHRGKININSTNVARGKNSLSNSLKKNSANLAKNRALSTLFMVPFINTYFTEKARQRFAEEAVKDFETTDGINVVTNSPIFNTKNF